MPRQKQPRVHNEWFRPVSLRDRKSCPTCGAKKEHGESIWSWGEYSNAKWYTVMHFCKNCFPSRVQKELIEHTKGCGCIVELVAYHSSLPNWLTLK